MANDNPQEPPMTETRTLWLDFLRTAHPLAADRLRLRRLVHDALFSASPRLVIHNGPGATGKSTFVKIVLHVTGDRRPETQVTTNHLASSISLTGADVVDWNVAIPIREQNPRLAELIIEREGDLVTQWLQRGGLLQRL